jgi:hypothetical protein
VVLDNKQRPLANCVRRKEMANVLLTAFPTLSQERTFGLDQREVAALQLDGIRQRFEELRPRVRVLDSLASDIGVEEVETLDDIIPLCMPHTMYKSYSARYIEEGRYDRLTEWFDGLSAEDLSAVDLTGVDSLESWLEALEAQTRLRPTVSSGTTGKVSFFPRTDVEADKFIGFILESWSGFRDELDSRMLQGETEFFSAVPMATGRQSFPRMFDLIRRRCFGGDGSHIHTLGKGHWDADMLWLWGRIRAAEARGETAAIELTPALERVRERLQETRADVQANMDNFIRELFVDFAGQRVFVFGPYNALIDLATIVRQRGIDPRLAPRTFTQTGGGTKGAVFPEGWEDLLSSVFPRPYQELYGMTETTAACRLCSAGWFHWPPSVITFVLDPDSGRALPRTGVQTGRLAVYDLCVENHWGGAITADRVTIDWDTPCPCGRKGSRVRNDIARYSDLREDDKITCARSAGAYEQAVETLVGL